MNGAESASSTVASREESGRQDVQDGLPILGKPSQAAARCRSLCESPHLEDTPVRSMAESLVVLGQALHPQDSRGS